MPKTTIRVRSAGENDWVVQEDDGQELGHYPTRASAETVGRTLAHKRRTVLLIEDERGREERTDFRGLFRRWIRGMRRPPTTHSDT